MKRRALLPPAQGGPGDAGGLRRRAVESAPTLDKRQLEALAPPKQWKPIEWTQLRKRQDDDMLQNINANKPAKTGNKDSLALYRRQDDELGFFNGAGADGEPPKHHPMLLKRQDDEDILQNGGGANKPAKASKKDKLKLLRRQDDEWGMINADESSSPPPLPRFKPVTPRLFRRQDDEWGMINTDESSSPPAPSTKRKKHRLVRRKAVDNGDDEGEDEDAAQNAGGIKKSKKGNKSNLALSRRQDDDLLFINAKMSRPRPVLKRAALYRRQDDDMLQNFAGDKPIKAGKKGSAALYRRQDDDILIRSMVSDIPPSAPAPAPRRKSRIARFFSRKRG